MKSKKVNKMYMQTTTLTRKSSKSTPINKEKEAPQKVINPDSMNNIYSILETQIKEEANKRIHQKAQISLFRRKLSF